MGKFEREGGESPTIPDNPTHNQKQSIDTNLTYQLIGKELILLDFPAIGACHK
jgi:hypothetical protein